jgi:hypothetical protein
MSINNNKESVNPEWHHNCRPFCRCCGGGDKRKGYKNTKAKSRSKNITNKRAKPKYKEHR